VTRDGGAAELFRTVGLRPDGPAILGRPFRASGGGVFVIELPAPLPAGPIEITRIGKWIERVPSLTLDGVRPTSKQLAARLNAFWLPSRTVLYIGSTPSSIVGRVAALERHVLGDRRPHASSQWLKTLSVSALKVWWAETSAAEEYEDALLTAFAEGVPPEEAARLHDPARVLPFANLKTTAGESKAHGIQGAVLPAVPEVVMPPLRRVDVPPGDADGARREARGSGTLRRVLRPMGSAELPLGRRRANERTRAEGAPTRRPPAPKPPRTARPGDQVLLSAEGLTRLRGEHEELVARRPGVVGRIRAAKELGDLKENSDYHAAREEQGFLEGRIQAVEAQLRAAVVVDAPSDTTRVAMGSHVTVEVDGEESRLTIVGTTESKPSAGRISQDSPVGRALVGKNAGDVAVVRTPGGEVRYRIVAID
jgi:transcription elongation factor GreA